MKKIFFNKNILIFILSVIVGVLVVPMAFSLVKSIKNTVSEIQKNNIKSSQEHNEPWHKNMGCYYI